MRIIFLLLLSVTMLMALQKEIQSFVADFKQIITDDEEKTLTYTGRVWSLNPDKGLWSYLDPIVKKVFIQKQRVIIIEPDLEQAVIKKLDRDIDLNAIIESAREQQDGTYEAIYNNQRFIIEDNKHGEVESIRYQDNFGNQVQILFSHQQYNSDIGSEIFNPEIPTDYDIIE